MLMRENEKWLLPSCCRPQYFRYGCRRLWEDESELTGGGVSRPISYDCVALLKMLSILSEIDGNARRARVTGGGGRKNSVSKTHIWNALLEVDNIHAKLFDGQN